MTRKKRMILLSTIIVVICLAIAAGATYALFSDNVNLGNHLEAGTLDISLVRTKLETKTLDQVTGLMTENVYEEDIDFSEKNDSNIFGIDSDTMVVPGCMFDAEMTIGNKGDVAFSYWIEIVLTDKEDVALANQLRVTVTDGENTYTSLLSEGLTVGGADKPIGDIIKDAKATFNVKVEFVESPENNSAQGKKVDFDLIVHAVQKTETK